MPKKLRNDEEPDVSIQKMCDHTDRDAANIEQVIKASAPNPEPPPPPPPPPLPQG